MLNFLRRLLTLLQKDKNSEDFEAQILEIEIKILKLEVEQNELQEKKKQLVGAKDISSKRRIEGKTNEQ